MSYQFNRRQFRGVHRCAAPVPGDVHHWRPAGVGHGKFHLCISNDFEFLWLNKPKDRRYRDDIPISADDIRFIKARPERLSFVSCQPIISLSGLAEFARLADEIVGNVATCVLADILYKLLAARTTDPQEARRVRQVIDDYRSNGLID